MSIVGLLPTFYLRIETSADFLFYLFIFVIYSSHRQCSSNFFQPPFGCSPFSSLLNAKTDGRRGTMHQIINLFVLFFGAFVSANNFPQTCESKTKVETIHGSHCWTLDNILSLEHTDIQEITSPTFDVKHKDVQDQFTTWYK